MMEGERGEREKREGRGERKEEEGSFIVCLSSSQELFFEQFLQSQ